MHSKTRKVGREQWVRVIETEQRDEMHTTQINCTEVSCFVERIGRGKQGGRGGMVTWSISSIEAFVAVPLDPSVTAARASKRALSGRVPFDPSRSIAEKGGGGREVV